MKVTVLNVLVAALIATVFTARADDSSDKIKMTTEAGGKVSVYVAGSGTATVDWGDGSEKLTLALDERGVEFEHSYPNAAARTIAVNGECITGLACSSIKLTDLDVSRNTELTRLTCSYNQLTSLDVSKNTALIRLFINGNQLTSLDVGNNTALTNLECHANQLTGLDVSQNTALTYLVCGSNQLADAALNALFGTLHSNKATKIIVDNTTKIVFINVNPGTNSCDRSIAESKGWRVITNYQ